MVLLKFYHYVNTEISDVRTKDWILIASPIPITLSLLAYLYLVLRCGPRYMKNRPAYSCLTFVKYYNIFQILANAYLVYHVIENGWYQDFLLKCNGFTYGTDRKSMKYASIAWYFMCLKLIDYTETVVFVLRKKHRQVSFLHLYHHVSIVLISWLYTKALAVGDVATGVVLNCTVHVIMYTYYLLSSMGPKVQRYISPVKPLITSIQMVQFIIVGLYATIYIQYCDAPTWSVVILVFVVGINFILFYNFYKKTYTTTKKEK